MSGGAYVRENLEHVMRLNRGVIDDLDFVQPGKGGAADWLRGPYRLSSTGCVFCDHTPY